MVELEREIFGGSDEIDSDVEEGAFSFLLSRLQHLRRYLRSVRNASGPSKARKVRKSDAAPTVARAKNNVTASRAPQPLERTKKQPSSRMVASSSANVALAKAAAPAPVRPPASHTSVQVQAGGASVAQAAQATPISTPSRTESPYILDAYRLVIKASEGGATEECCETLLDAQYKTLSSISRTHGVKIVGLGAMARDMEEVRARLAAGTAD